MVKWIQEQIGKPFAWGETHCAAIVFGALDQLRKSNFSNCEDCLMVQDEESAKEVSARHAGLKILEAAGFVDVEERMTVRLGDIFWDFENEMECLHICTGEHFVSSDYTRGVLLVPALPLMRIKHKEGRLLRCQSSQ